MKTKDFGLFFWLHFALILFAYLSPLWLDWRVILVSVALLQVYYLWRGGCDLTFLQFGNDKDTTFLWYYIRKIFPSLNQKKTKFFVRVIIPIILVTVSFVSQYVYGFETYVF